MFQHPVNDEREFSVAYGIREVLEHFVSFRRESVADQNVSYKVRDKFSCLLKEWNVAGINSGYGGKHLKVRCGIQPALVALFF